MFTIRNYRSGDLPALMAICLATGDSGRDAAAKYDNPDLLGQIYVAPYARLAPELVWVVEDQLGVAGYIVGVYDSNAWFAQLERDWWPQLRRYYPDPADLPTHQRNADQHLAAIIHKPGNSPASILANYPAHIHMNLLPRLQRQGQGTKLLETWMKAAANAGVFRIHLGAARDNHNGVNFWKRSGFRSITLPEETDSQAVWMVYK